MSREVLIHVKEVYLLLITVNKPLSVEKQNSQLEGRNGFPLQATCFPVGERPEPLPPLSLRLEARLSRYPTGVK